MKSDNYMYVHNKIDYSKYTPNPRVRDMNVEIEMHFKKKLKRRV